MIELVAQELTVVLQAVCESSIPRKRRFRKSNPWCTRDLSSRSQCIGCGERCREPTHVAVLQKYRSSLREHSKEVKRAKLKNWGQFVTSQGNAEA